MSSEERERCYDLEHVKFRVLSHMIESSVLPPRKPLDEVAGQKVIVALETFLHEVYCYTRDNVFLKRLLPPNMAPEIHLLLNQLLPTSNASEMLGEGRKLIQGESYPIDVVTVGQTTDESCCSRSQSFPAPTLHLCGSQLESIGVGLGAHIGVFLGENELILRAVPDFVDGPDQAAGGAGNV
jgi:hypothetical protein